MLWVGLGSAAVAADLAVGAGRPFTELQDAIDAAAPGDRILVDPGRYAPIAIDRDVEIASRRLGEAVIEAGPGVAAVTVAPLAEPVLRGLALDGSGVDRALQVGAGATVVLEDAAVADGVSGDEGGCALVDSAALVVRRATFTGCTASLGGGGIYADESSVTLEAVTFDGDVVTDGFGGGLGADRSDVVVRGGAFEDDLAMDTVGNFDLHGLGGGMFVGNSATLDLVGTAFDRDQGLSTAGPVAGRGGAIRLWQTYATVRYASFSGDHATAYGSAIASAASQLALEGASLNGNVVEVPAGSATHGGAVFCDEWSSCAIDRSWFEGNAAADGGALSSIGDLTVTRSMFCANQGTGDGGAIDVGDTEPGKTFSVSGNVIALNSAAGDGGALVLNDGPHTVRNNHVVGNSSAGSTISAHLVDNTHGIEVIDDLIAGNVDGGAPVIDSRLTLTEDWNAYWDNTPSMVDPVLGAHSWIGDPGLAGPIASCDPLDLAPGPDSPLVDAGGPETLRDADGSPADIGAFGGPDGDLASFLDADGDGWVAMLDCDDSLASVHPTAPEVCDGVDDDCDELVDDADDAVDAAWRYPDQDGDGVGSELDAAWRCAGPGWADSDDDCDDGDPTRSAPVTWYLDADGDQVGDSSTAHTDCDPPDGAVLVGGDCDDRDPTRTEGCSGDQDGDGVVDSVDPDPDDAGGVVATPPEPPPACGCASSGGASGSVPIAALLGWLALRRSRTAKTAEGASRIPGA